MTTTARKLLISLAALTLSFAVGVPALAKAAPQEWVIVLGNESPAVVENVERLRQELTSLAGRKIGIVDVAALTPAQRAMSNLILVGRYDGNSLVREALDPAGPSDPFRSAAPYVREQGYLVATHPTDDGTGQTVIAVGWDAPGALYAVSHLRTHFQAHDGRLYLDLATEDVSKTGDLAYKLFQPSFEERAVYYNVAWSNLGRMTPPNWTDDDWEHWLDKQVCAQFTHVYFFLWGSSIYFPKSPFSATEENRLLHERLQRMIRCAHRRGLKVTFGFAPTQIPKDIFDANKDVLRASVVYAEHGYPDVCSAVPDEVTFGKHSWNGARELMADIYGREIEWFREADAFQLWFYDVGGCFCGPDKHDCKHRQPERMLEQVDDFYAITRRANPQSQLVLSLWPVWELERIYEIKYRNEFLRLLKQYAAEHDKQREIISVSDTLMRGDTTLTQAREQGLRLNGFIFPTNVETGYHLLIPMLDFVQKAATDGKARGVRAIHHMRIEEPSKFANTFVASRHFWNANASSEDALRQYVRWVANSNAGSADKLQQAFLLLDSFTNDGADSQDHRAKGAQIRDLIEAAFQPLPKAKRAEHEWLLTTGRAVAIIGDAVDSPERMPELSRQFAALMRESPTFAPTSTSLERYVKCVEKGWSKENF